jgi:hypothetical protein
LYNIAGEDSTKDQPDSQQNNEIEQLPKAPQSMPVVDSEPISVIDESQSPKTEKPSVPNGDNKAANKQTEK